MSAFIESMIGEAMTDEQRKALEKLRHLDVDMYWHVVYLIKAANRYGRVNCNELRG